MLIGIIVGIVVVGALSYATGLTKLLLRPFGSSFLNLNQVESDGAWYCKGIQKEAGT